MKTVFALFFVMSLSAFLPMTLAFGQTSTTPTSTIFQSDVDSIRLEVPKGWVIEDINNTDPLIEQEYRSVRWGWELSAVLCPQTQTLPKIGGGYECSSGAYDDVWIMKFPDLSSRPEFAVLARENKSIIISDFLAYFMQLQEEETEIRSHILLKNIDRVVNVTDPQTNQTISTAPAKYVEMSYIFPDGRTSDKDFALLALNNDNNTGYVLHPRISMLTASGESPPEHQQIFDSFELVQQR